MATVALPNSGRSRIGPITRLARAAPRRMVAGYPKRTRSANHVSPRGPSLLASLAALASLVSLLLKGYDDRGF